jgi:hypothetical protein
VIHTELEEGAVLLHLESGLYYSLDAVGLEIWRQIEGGRRVEDIARAVTERFDVQHDAAEAAVVSFVEQLARERLVIPADGDLARADAAPAGVPGPVERKPFALPALIKHDEPLHQVALHPFDPQLPLAE